MSCLVLNSVHQNPGFIRVVYAHEPKKNMVAAMVKHGAFGHARSEAAGTSSIHHLVVGRTPLQKVHNFLEARLVPGDMYAFWRLSGKHLNSSQKVKV